MSALDALITDLWFPPHAVSPAIPRFMNDRFHPDLAHIRVLAHNTEALLSEFTRRAKGLSGWPLIIARNRWFQRRIVRSLHSLTWSSAHSTHHCDGVVFSFSYTALEVFKWAKKHGFRTILGQIDGGKGHERLMSSLNKSDTANSPPTFYWEDWQEECRLSDRIIVNSKWAYELLVSEGITQSKIRVVPLAYIPPVEAKRFLRTYPEFFTRERPLRVLFLGQVNKRKGVQELLEAMAGLTHEPIELYLVGPELMDVPTGFKSMRNIHWIGNVPRSNVANYYRNADVFVFPTHSDGFGLTQLEAQAWKLPVIASRNCGDVVMPGVNGQLICAVKASEISAALRHCLNNPTDLRNWSANSSPLTFDLASLGQRLSAIADEL